MRLDLRFSMAAEAHVDVQAVKENARPMAEEVMQNQVKPAMVDAGATAEQTAQVRRLQAPVLCGCRK